ncbi:hypothetical protein RFI_16462 [Reticulomyxa filosa]|uniref:DUS-like FMN-binding domain-containing protein n=1 Tax=Reticulomyxa filosa TaxID=46433 RepID=X6N4B8_RETFI|nr:hypothetical protein RFI_16462 [Reticulomyxa filosa]|eukprot:ETO20758.1 hypothetical protein RFI_16462 [Reticulomyxa filosa]
MSIKIRIHKDIRQTVDFVRQVQSAGVSFLTVHGRTLQERTKVPVHLDEIATVLFYFVIENVDIPVLANGDIREPNDIFACIDATNAQGVMSARGILSNPALFAGYTHPPKQCVQGYFDQALQFGGHFKIHHHHLMFLLSTHYLTKSEKKDFNSRKSMCSLLDFLKDRQIYTLNTHTNTV